MPENDTPERLREIAAELLTKANELERSSDPYKNGDVISFQKGQLTYVAVKAGGYWWTTGVYVQHQRWTWEQLVENLGTDGVLKGVQFLIDIGVLTPEPDQDEYPDPERTYFSFRDLFADYRDLL